MVHFDLNVGLNLYTPTTKDSASGLWNGTLANANGYKIPVGEPAPTTLARIAWAVWYMYFDGTAIRHITSSTPIKFKVHNPYINNEYIYPDMHMNINFDPYNTRHSSEHKYSIELFFEDYSTEVLQYDSGVYGACEDAIRMLGGASKKVFENGSVGGVPSNCIWKSFMDCPTQLDPTYKKYRFYDSEIPGYALPARTAFLESFILGAWSDQTVPRNFRGSNYSKLTQLLNSQVQTEPIGHSISVRCVDKSVTGSNLARIKGHGYHIMNIKPSSSIRPDLGNRYYNFPFKPDASTFGGHVPWCDNTYGAYPLLDNCFCWNHITFSFLNGASTEYGFISNCPNVGDVANSRLVPTNNFTYSGLLVKNSATYDGPLGVYMEDGEWFDFKICPSSWHMSPSWDIICHSPQIKWCNMGPINFMGYEVSRAGWHDMTTEKLNKC